MPIKIIVIGGSYAGVKAGKTLSRKFKDNDNVDITLIDKNPYHTLMTELHEVAGHRTEPDSIKIDLFKIFAERKADIVVDEIKDIDFKKQLLKSEKREYAYDYLIIAAGNEANFFGTKGADINAFTLWSYEDAIKIRQHVEEMFLKASYEKDYEERKKLLTFAVCGGGFTGVEMAGELGEAKNHLSEKYGVDKSEVTIYNIEALDRILNMLESEDQVKKVEDKYYKKLGIDLIKNSMIVEVNENCIVLERGEIINTNTLIWTAGIKNCEFSSRLGLESDKFGRIKVNEYMQTKNYGNVYAAGDNAQYEDEDGKMPQIVEAAEQSAHTAALNISADIEKTEKHTHKQNYHGFMVSVGSRKAVADTGFKTSGWFAMLIKHMVNFYYGIMVGGLRQFWSYIRHEFFHIKNKRSFVGGHFSKASPNFWLVPFRLWLGFMWLVEGIKKIDEGWLREPKMFESTAVNNIIQGAGSGADSTAGATQSAADVVTEAAADVVTSATGAADTIVETVSNLPVYAQWIVNHSPQGWGQPLVGDVPGFMQWIINKIVAPNAVPFQTMMVVTEIIIGLCLIVGLLTFLCSAVSVVMTVGITLTGMSDATIIWYFFGGIALIAGAGSTFGFDYYVMPFLKRKWKSIGIVRKSYLYFD
jgi:NADH dehydrogenase